MEHENVQSRPDSVETSRPSRATEVVLTVLNLVLAAALILVIAVAVKPPPGSPGPGRSEYVQTRYPQQERSARLVNDLLSKPELIPFSGTLGGTMGFYSPENIYVLSDHWVFARFEDGHTGGSMLLEYRLDDAGEIHWEVLQARLDS